LWDQSAIGARIVLSIGAKICQRAQAMANPVSSNELDELDGLNATRALILQAYYALRRRVAARQIGTREIAEWIERHEPKETLPSYALIQLTLTEAEVPHRVPGRPRNDTTVTPFVPPFLTLRRTLRLNRPQR
jgi:hypothetical protein